MTRIEVSTEARRILVLATKAEDDGQDGNLIVRRELAKNSIYYRDAIDGAISNLAAHYGYPQLDSR